MTYDWNTIKGARAAFAAGDTQAAFDRVVRFIHAQGARSMLRGTTCAYRGDGGRRCAIGCLIPDAAYSERLEGAPALNALQDAGLVPSRCDPERHGNFALVADALQLAHDHCENGKPDMFRVAWLRRCKRVADDYGLIMPTIEGEES